MQFHTRMRSLPVSYSCALVLWHWNVMSSIASLASRRISCGYRILSTIWSCPQHFCLNGLKVALSSVILYTPESLMRSLLEVETKSTPYSRIRLRDDDSR